MTNWQHHTVLTNGINLSYYRSPGDKTPLVMLHGITDNAMAWRRAALQLQDDFTLIMVDARGHGDSDKPEGDYHSADHVADVAGLITTLELEKPIVMGHSMGAATASRLAAEHPDLVGALVLEDPPWRSVEKMEPEHLKEWQKGLAAQQTRSREELIQQAQQDSPKWNIIDIEDWADSKLAVSLNVLNYVGGRFTWRESVAKIQCPTLLIRADTEAGAIVAADVAEEAETLNPKLQSVYISGAGHCIRRENFADFMAAVTQFLKNLK